MVSLPVNKHCHCFLTGASFSDPLTVGGRGGITGWLHTTILNCHHKAKLLLTVAVHYKWFYCL